MSWFGMHDAGWLELASTLLAVLGGFVLVLFAWMLLRLVRPDPVQSAWAQFCRKLGARGVARAPHEGPRDYAERAARDLPAASEPIRNIAALYIALRYGAGEPAGGKSAQAESVVQLRRMVGELSFG